MNSRKVMIVDPVCAGTKKVTVVTPGEATALSSAIAAVQQVRKQAESAAKGSTP